MTGRAVIVGGGPAGLSAACGLARAGFDVVVLEQRRTWQGRVCGGFINPEGVSHLAWLGALEPLRRAGAVDVTAARLTVPTGREGTVRVTRRGVPGLGVSRETLESVLAATAVAAGATVQVGARVTDVVAARDGQIVTVRGAKAAEDRIEAALVVMADGRFSLGRPTALLGRTGWFGWNATFEGVRQAPGDLSMHFYRGGYVGVLTFGDGQTNVCGLVKRSGVEAEAWEAVSADAAAHQPVLAGMLEHACRVSPWRGVGPLPFGRFTAATPGTLLAGDAGGVGDPYMGEGISRGLATGRLLSEACTRGGEVVAPGVSGATRAVAAPAVLRLSGDYARAWSRHYTPRLWLGPVVRAVMDRPALFERMLGVLLRRPGTLHALSGVFHAG